MKDEKRPDPDGTPVDGGERRDAVVLPFPFPVPHRPPVDDEDPDPPTAA